MRKKSGPVPIYGRRLIPVLYQLTPEMIAFAKSQNMSASAYIRSLIEAEMKKKGV